MKINFLGTCSGTEPIMNFRHVSIAIEHNGNIYWFDAGDNCAYAAHTSGKINILKTRAIFISHTHLDHTAGLPFLLSSINKIETKWNKKQILPIIDIFMPQPNELQHIIAILHYRKDRSTVSKVSALHNNHIAPVNGMWSSESTIVKLAENVYKDGIIFEEDNFKISALHNNHIAPVNGMWSSYSFLIEANGKSVIYSGDIKSVNELAPLLVNHTDLIIMETGHHSAEEVCQYFADSNYKFKELAFTHHGRAVLNDFDGEAEKCRRILGDKVFMCTDGMTHEV